MAGIDTPLKGASLNCQWPEYGSTQTKVRQGKVKAWSVRVKLLAASVKRAGLHFFGAQELGQTQAAQLAAALGGDWSYQRLGLNCVFWRKDVLDYVKTVEVDLPDYGQWPGRGYVEVWLKDKKGNRLRVGSTHFSVKLGGVAFSSKDKAAQQDQTQRVVSAVNNEADDWPLVILVDTNNKQRGSAPLQGGMWKVAEKYGYTWDRSGVDAVLWNFGVKIARVDRLDLGSGSDHDGRVFALTTNKK